MILKAYKYRLLPNKPQQIHLNKHCGCSRFIYNWALNLKTELYKTKNEKLTFYDLNKKLPSLKQEYIWLKEVNAQSLQQSIKHLENAYTKFFREKKGFPKFKKKGNRQSFSAPQHVKINLDNKTIILPKIKGEIKFSDPRKFTGKVKNCVISKTPTDKYFISILVEVPGNLPKKPKIKKDKTIGVDLGIKHFLITSNGEKIENPKTLRKFEPKLKHLHKLVSKKVKGSENRRKTVKKLARVYEKVSNIRTDFLHKVSTKLIRENQTICLETLNVSGMLKNHCLAKSISDCSWSTFIEYLKYKSEWFGTNLVFIGRFEPSSKMCSKCGNINKELTLKDRTWTCKKCNQEHDRDINAAINIKDFGLQKQNLLSKKDKELSTKMTLLMDCEKVMSQENKACKDCSVNEKSSRYVLA